MFFTGPVTSHTPVSAKRNEIKLNLKAIPPPCMLNDLGIRMGLLPFKSSPCKNDHPFNWTDPLDHHQPPFPSQGIVTNKTSKNRRNLFPDVTAINEQASSARQTCHEMNRKKNIQWLHHHQNKYSCPVYPLSCKTQYIYSSSFGPPACPLGPPVHGRRRTCRSQVGFSTC